MHVMPTCHFDDAGRRRLALLNDPKLLDRGPSPPPLRTRQNRNLAHVCSFACKSISKLSLARLPPGRRPSPEDYVEPADFRQLQPLRGHLSENGLRFAIGRNLCQLQAMSGEGDVLLSFVD
jgi:hypothetical protein